MGTSVTPNLELTEISESDSEAADQFNDSFLSLDALVQCAVLSRSTTAAPPTADQGDRYIVPVAGVLSTDPWFGHARQIAYRTTVGWSFKTPRPGWEAYIQDESSGSPAAVTKAVYIATEWITKADPASILTTKGDLIVQQADEPGRFPADVIDGRTLFTDHTQPFGIDWRELVQFKGGILTNDGTKTIEIDATTHSAGQVLTLSAGLVPQWADTGGGAAGSANVTPDTHPVTPDVLDDEFEGTAPATWTDHLSTTGTALSVVQDAGSLIVANMGTQTLAKLQAAPASPWEFMIRTAQWSNSSGSSWALGALNSATGAVTMIAKYSGDGEIYVQQGAFNTSTWDYTFASNVTHNYSSLIGKSDWIYLKLVNDGTNLSFQVSLTGQLGTFVVLWSETIASHVATADRLMLGANLIGSGAFSAAVDWFRRTA